MDWKVKKDIPTGSKISKYVFLISKFIIEKRLYNESRKKLKYLNIPRMDRFINRLRKRKSFLFWELFSKEIFNPKK